MSYETEAAKQSNQPLQAIGIKVDVCSLTAGVSPCTATQTGDAKCYNTLVTCNDRANYDETTKEYKFCNPASNLPIGENMFPALISADVTPTTVTGGKGLGDRAVSRVKIKDFPHHDRGIDPYWDERTYNAETTGTFWGKFLARNPYYESRELKHYYGFITDTFDWGNFRTELYIIEKIDHSIDSISIVSKDILSKTYGHKNIMPPLLGGYLQSDIAASAASAVLLPAGIGSEYPAGYLKIGEEIKSFGRLGDTLYFTGHGLFGTEDVAHKAGDNVQLVYVFPPLTLNIVDILQDILFKYSGIPLANLDIAGWNEEAAIWLFTTAEYLIVSNEEPHKVIERLCSEYLFDIWWDSMDQLVKIKFLSPGDPSLTINTIKDEENIIANSLNIKRDPRKRYTTIHVYYGKINKIGDDSSDNYRYLRIATDTNRIGYYKSNAVLEVFAPDIDNTSQASQLAGRLLARYSDTQEEIEFKLHAKDFDKVQLAERVIIDSNKIQDVSGLNKPTKYQIIQKHEKDNEIKVKAISSYFTGRYGFFSPSGVPDYSSATPDQKDRYGFFCYNTGDFLDGEPAYKFI